MNTPAYPLYRYAYTAFYGRVGFGWALGEVWIGEVEARAPEKALGKVRNLQRAAAGRAPRMIKLSAGVFSRMTPTQSAAA